MDSYALEFEALARDLELTISELDGLELLLQFKLDSSRNQLLLVDVLFAITSTWVNAALIVAGIGGMNVYNGKVGTPDTDDTSVWLLYVCVSGMGGLCMIVLSILVLLKLGFLRVF